MHACMQKQICKVMMRRMWCGEEDGLVGSGTEWQNRAGCSSCGPGEKWDVCVRIDWQTWQISHLVCNLAGQRWSKDWGTFRTWTGQSITVLMAWRKEEWRKEVADIQPSEVGNNLCSTRQTLALFLGQPWGDCWETGWSAYGPFWALWCYLGWNCVFVRVFMCMRENMGNARGWMCVGGLPVYLFHVPYALYITVASACMAVAVIYLVTLSNATNEFHPEETRASLAKW